MLKVKVEQRSDDATYVYLSGAIDEAASFGQLFEGLDTGAVFNLREIERINSIGVNAWVRRFEPYTRRHPAAVDELSYAFVMQANCVANLFGEAEVRSCLAPYFCEECNDTLMMVVTADQLRESHDSVPLFDCPECKSRLEFDELDEYFDFLRRTL